MPFSTEQAITIALSHHQAGRLAEAEGVYRQILSKEPNHAVVLDYLGVVAIQTRRLELAASLLRRSVAADPSKASTHCNLGECLRQLGKYEGSIGAFREAIRLNPRLAVAHNNLGSVLAESGEVAGALSSYNTAIELNPDYAEAYSNLANAMKEQGRLDDALAAARESLRLNPHSAESHNNLGVILAGMDRSAEAIVAYRRAVELKPNYANAWSNLGNAFAAENMHEQAAIASKRAIDLEPLTIQSHWNYAVILLRNGDLHAGWREYEWRWATQAHFPKPAMRFHPPRFPTPHWTGGDVRGKTLLLHAEQGFGDTLNFCRYAPIVAALGTTVIMEVHPELCRLFQTLEGVTQVIARGEPLPRFDAHCPLMSLPLAFGTVLDSIPAEIPYLRADPELAGAWESIVSQADHRPRIGLCWAGSPTHSDDCDRSLSLSQLAPLSRCGATFYSLQKGPAAAQALHPPPGLALIDQTARLEDFADTAALIVHLDLVITVDTAVAHLAGAMGKPVWVLIRSLADWRWLIAPADTPWYPTMRLFRQRKPGEWGAVIETVAKALEEWRKTYGTHS